MGASRKGNKSLTLRKLQRIILTLYYSRALNVHIREKPNSAWLKNNLKMQLEIQANTALELVDPGTLQCHEALSFCLSPTVLAPSSRDCSFVACKNQTIHFFILA